MTGLEYAPQEEAEEETPAPAQASQLPEDIETIEELYLTAVHLEQYRHATYDPDDYYREGLRRDAGDIRLNNGYGKGCMHAGCTRRRRSISAAP